MSLQVRADNSISLELKNTLIPNGCAFADYKRFRATRPKRTTACVDDSAATCIICARQPAAVPKYKAITSQAGPRGACTNPALIEVMFRNR